MSSVPKVKTTTVSWKAIVEEYKSRSRRGQPSEKDETIAYEFSGGRKFREHTDPYHWAKD